MRVLVCGSRDWKDKSAIFDVLWRCFGKVCGPENRVLTVIQGGARGADEIAFEWAEMMAALRVKYETYPADWDAYGKAAGPIRNKEMLDKGKPEVVFAFKDFFDHTLSSGGTENMVKLARDAGIPVYLFGRIA